MRNQARARLVLSSMALVLVASAPSLARAVDGVRSGDGYAYELWTGLMSPYCPGRTLIDCPSTQASELRDWIAAQEQAGRTREEVEEQLYAQFGDVILQAPRASGLGLAAYVIPLVAVAAGAAIVVVFLRHQASRREPRPQESAPLPLPDPELERIVDREMEQV